MLKTIALGSVHFTVAFGVVFALTAGRVIGGLVALIATVVSNVAHHHHEHAWARFSGRSRDPRLAACATGA